MSSNDPIVVVVEEPIVIREGILGLPGPAGEQGPAGPVGMVWRGSWDATIAYDSYDVVQHGGSAWITLLGAQAGVEPGIEPEWELVAAAGEGATGGASPWQSNADETAIIPVDNSDSWIVGSDRMDRDTLDSSKDKRAFFNKTKGAFRAGTNGNTDWNDQNVGVDSYAVGRDTTASGEGSHAEGWATKATGTQSHAEGGMTYATGDRSHAEGQNTTASGARGHTEGYGTTASGGNSHSQGYNTTASGSGSHAEGSRTTADGAYSHAEGGNSRASGNTSRASGVDAVSPRWAQSSHAAGKFSANGDAQSSLLVLRQETSDELPALLSVGAYTTPITGNFNENVLTFALNRAHKIRIDAIARRTDVEGEAAGFSWEGVIVRDSGSPRIVGVPVENGWSDAAAAAWVLGVAINEDDPADPYLEVTGTGEAGKTIRWVATMHFTEVG